MYSLDDVFAGPADLYVDGKNVGWVRGGVRFRLNRALWFRPSLDGLGASEAVKTDEEFYVATVMAESTLGNLKKAWAINEAITNPNDSSDWTRIDFGGSVGIPVHTLRFVARSKTMQVVFYRVVAVDYGEVAYKVEMDAFIPVTFRALLDTSKSVGEQFGYIMQGPYMGQRDLLLSLNVPKIKTDTRYCRVVVLNYGSTNCVMHLIVPKIKTIEFVGRLIVRVEADSAVQGQLIVRVATSSSVVSRVNVVYIYSTSALKGSLTVIYAGETKDLVVRVDVEVLYVKLISRVTVVYAESSKDLVAQVDVEVLYVKLINRLIVRKEDTGSLVGQLTVVYAAAEKDLVSRLVVRGESAGNLTSRVTITS